MARVTVEDCKKIVSNHFELVVLTSRRGKDIGSGSPILVERNNDKNGVVALRELAAKKLNVDLLRENLLQDYRKTQKEEDNLDDNKQENYLEMDDQEEGKAESTLDDAFAEIDDFAIAEGFDSEEMSFESDNLDVED